MKEIIKKNLLTILNIFFGLLILPLLFVIMMINPENVFQFNLGDFYTNIYILYFIFGLISLILFRFIKIKNGLLKEEILYTIKFIFFISIILLPSFIIAHNFVLEHAGEANLYFRVYGRIAFLYFALTLMISPILIYIKNSSLRDNLLFIRKILGILAFLFTLKHGIEYFSMEYLYYGKYYQDISYFEYVYNNLLVRYDALSGVIVGIMMLILGLTSNKVSIKLFSGKGWKLIQSLVYPAFLLTVIHVALSSRFDNFYTFLAIIVVGLRTVSYLSNKTIKKSGKTTKYICIPCGYIYDENVGDPDSGLEPGTKFEDIPDDWYCPVCGVSKADFEPYYEEDNTVFGGCLAEVVGNKMITDDVLELSLKIDEDKDVLKGQYAILILNDFDGEFSRAYSIVEYKNNILKFGIKLKDIGRGGRKLKTIKKGDTIKIKGIYGDFVLQENKNPKVFIATGTGLSPIINMISTKLKSKNNYLFFGVQKEKDLFYLDKIQKIDNIETHICLSRENVEGFEYGRIDLSKYTFEENTEFYICGNPAMVEGNIKYLKEKGFKNIYSEKF